MPIIISHDSVAAERVKQRVEDQKIKEIVTAFRSAIDRCKDSGEFIHDPDFCKFPRRCCGHASKLLAEYLKQWDVETILVSSSKNHCSHTWLVVKDTRIRKPITQSFLWPEEMQAILKGYGAENPEKPIINRYYSFNDLQHGLILDITSDQFDKNYNPAYVGYIDSFHRSFDFIRARDYDESEDFDERLRKPYQIIIHNIIKE